MSDVENPFRHSGSQPGRTLLSLMVSLACASLAQGLHAQEAIAPTAIKVASPAAAAASGVDSVMQVTVSATRRREPAREVPMQVQAVSAEQLQNAGAHQLADYLAGEPGVEVSGPAAGQGTVSIRGVSTGNQTISTVGLYIDDVAFGSSSAYVNGAQSALDMSLLDLNHIEVLRGPQGTLYGAGAMGGLVKYVTNEPDTYALTGKVSVGASFTKDGGVGHTESAVVNVPLKEDVAGLRVAVFHDHAGGWVDATGASAGKNINQGDSNGARVSLLLEPTNRFHVRATALSQEIHRDGNDYVDYDAATGRPVVGDLKRSLTLREPYSTRVQLGSLDLEDDLGWARFNSITSAQASGLDRHLDYTAIYNPLLGNAFETIPVSLVSHVQKQTQEFRLTSPGGGSLEWLGGLFWTHESGVNHQSIASTTSGGAGPLLLGAELPSSLTEVAAYGDVTWKPMAGLAVTGGIRVAHNRQRFSEDLSGALTAPESLDGSSSETAKTYLATVSYALTPTSNVYVRAASGYRPGGPNAALGDSDTGDLLAPLQFKHDSLWSYEAGYKADLLDKTLSLEASVYDIKWDNIQQLTAVQGLSVIVNAGKATVQGLELGARWKAGQRLSVNGSLSYMDAHLTDGAEGLGGAGAPLPNSARLSGNAGADYSFDLAGYSAWIGGSERFVGGRHAGFAGSGTAPDFHMPAYWMSNLQAGVDLKRFQVSLYVRNVFDKRAIVSASTIYVPLGGPVQAQVAQPRTLGVNLSASF